MGVVDRYTKFVLTVIAVCLVVLAGDALLKPPPEGIVNVRVVGGQLDYETDLRSGPTLKVCIDC
jgi:hypothetical protein